MTPTPKTPAGLGPWLLAMLLLAAAASLADAQDFTFRHEGFSEGAFVTGTFSGIDANADGQLSSFGGEITAFSMEFSGNALVPAFTADFANLFGLVYDVNAGPILGDGFTLAIEGIGTPGAVADYVSGNGPGFPGSGLISGPDADDFSDELPRVTLVPEPGSAVTAAAAWLVASGRRRRVSSVSII